MRTNIESKAFAALGDAERRAVEGGYTLTVRAVSDVSGTAISKYLGEITDRLSPTPVIGPDRLANIGERLP